MCLAIVMRSSPGTICGKETAVIHDGRLVAVDLDSLLMRADSDRVEHDRVGDLDSVLALHILSDSRLI